MTHLKIPALRKSLVFGWFQDWADENIKRKVSAHHDRYDQLMYVANRAVEWGVKQALLQSTSEGTTNAGNNDDH